MAFSSTATQRTYRYLRLSIVGAVVVLFVSLGVVSVQIGGVPSSISAMFYTPARTVFVGVLFAVAAAFLALSGHSLSRALIDLAALFAVLIAIIPTPIGAGDIAGIDPSCRDAGARCVPPGEHAAITNGLVTFLIFGIFAVIVILVVAALHGSLHVGVGWTAAAASAVIIGVAGWWMFWPDTLLAVGHFVVTTCFFALTAVVAGLGARYSSGAYRAVYAVIAITLLLDLSALLITSLAHVPFVLGGEIIGLVLFGAFWLVQTVQNWSNPDPALIG